MRQLQTSDRRTPPAPNRYPAAPAGFDIILRDAFARGVKLPKGELRIRIAGFGAVAQVGKFLLRLAQVRRHHPLGNGAVRQHDLRAEVIS